MAIIGIDLGTTYSAAARFVDGAPEIINLDGGPTLPSVVGVQANGKIVVGRIAKHNQAQNPQDTIVEVKRKMGKNVDVPLGQKTFKPQEISAMILSKIKELAEADLGEEITGAVISCPAYFKDPERHATKEAGEIAGLNVLRIINEPTAAAYAYGVLNQDADKENLFLVYDLGGGTFDVTVISMVAGSLEVIGTGGDPQLGGGNFDDCIVEWMLEHIKQQYPAYYATMTDNKLAALKLKLKAHAEEAKKRLCGPPAQEMYQFQIAQFDKFEGKPLPFREELTMTKFEELINDLMQNSLKWVDEAFKAPKENHNYTEADITEILLVGGSTRVPLVRQILEQRFPNTPLRGLESGINPDEIVARGASIIAAEADPESDEVSKTILIDVTGHTLSVAAFNPEQKRELLQPIIEKETPIPTSGVHIFGSAGNFQRQCNIRVYQGEGIEITNDVTMIGEFFIEIDPVQDSVPLQIGLDLDENGILIAHATNVVTGQQVKCQINYEDSAQMSPEVLKQKQAQLAAQMKAAVGATPNPLDEQPGAVQPPGAWPQPALQPTTPTPPLAQRMPASAQPAATTPADPSAMMNPMMRTLYNKAINNFDRLPPSRQGQAMQLVIDIQNAAQAGDQAKLMSYLGPLSQLLQGID